MLLIVIVDSADRLDARVFSGCVVFLGGSFVPIQDTADEGGDEEGAGFGAGDGLDFAEEEGEVAVDGVFGLQLLGGEDAFPG